MAETWDYLRFSVGLFFSAWLVSRSVDWSWMWLVGLAFLTIYTFAMATAVTR